MEFIKNLSEISRDDLALVGGKGASLGEMIQQNILVPPGFVVLSPLHEEFLRSKEVSNEAKSQIVESFRGLNSKFVAVRSSATVEDGKDDAWAGQLETYLNTTEDNLLENIKKCWDSINSPRALAYRKEKGLGDKNISVAVIIQKMIESEVSGTAFSVHPVTEDPDQMIIEAAFGLGEAVVSGQITPDSYVVSKKLNQIISKNISEQKGSVQQKLSDSQILELSGLVLKIERHYQFPCDIEWAYAHNQFYVLQSRPITTLNK